MDDGLLIAPRASWDGKKNGNEADKQARHLADGRDCGSNCGIFSGISVSVRSGALKQGQLGQR